MPLALSTHWNAMRHTHGEAMLDEIQALGFDTVELGYDLRIELVEGVKARVEAGAIRVCSVHNFCPVPLGAPRGSPELYTLADPNADGRECAVRHTTQTIRFAGEVGARAVVAHAGYIELRRGTPDLIALYEKGQAFSPAFERIKFKMLQQRERAAAQAMDRLCGALDRLIPILEESGVVLALENLPRWEALPTEAEMERLLQRYVGAPIRYWHDLGHACVREHLGFVNALRWLERLRPGLAGFHIHDTKPPYDEHRPPGKGIVDFARLRPFISDALALVVEPSQGTPREALEEGLKVLREKGWPSVGTKDGEET